MRSSVHPLRPVLATVLTVLLAVGCTAGGSFTPGGGGGGGPSSTPDDDAGPGPEPQAGQDELVIRFLNLSDVVVDPEFYSANEPLDDPLDELFDPAFRVQTGIGLAGSSLLDSGGSGQITVPCSGDTVVGTAGGEYLDRILGTTLGTGQRRIAQVDLNFDCGNTIIFTYRGENGEYQTEPPIPDFTD